METIPLQPKELIRTKLIPKLALATGGYADIITVAKVSMVKICSNGKKSLARKKRKNVLSFLTPAHPLPLPSTRKVIAVCPEHVPIIPINADFGIIADFIVADGESGGESASVLEHGDGDIYMIYA